MLLVLLSACTGLTVPDQVDGTLSATTATGDIVFEVSLRARAAGACHEGSPYVLEVSGSDSNNTVALTIDGYENGGDLNGVCADLGEAIGSFELPAFPIGEALQLEVSLAGELNTFEIERSIDNVIITEIDGRNVGLGCSGNWGASAACKVQP